LYTNQGADPISAETSEGLVPQPYEPPGSYPLRTIPRNPSWLLRKAEPRGVVGLNGLSGRNLSEEKGECWTDQEMSSSRYASGDRRKHHWKH